VKKIDVLILFILIPLSFYSCKDEKQNSFKFIDGMKSFFIEDIGNDRKLMVVNVEDGINHWYLFETRSNYIYLGDNYSSFSNVDQIKVSKNNKYLAILSSGEGHPALDVIDLKSLIGLRKSKILFAIDPFPGYMIDIINWVDERLIVESDALLTHIDKESGRVPECLLFKNAERFALTMDDRQILPLSYNAKNPASYFKKQLKSKDIYRRSNAMNALEILADKN
jgi:hypothetical protein